MIQTTDIYQDCIVYVSKYIGNTKKMFSYDHDNYYEIYRGLKSVSVNLSVSSIGTANIGIALPSMDSKNITGFDDNILLKRALKVTVTRKGTSTKKDNFEIKKDYTSLSDVITDITENYYEYFKYTNLPEDKAALESNITGNNPDVLETIFKIGAILKIGINADTEYTPVYYIDGEEKIGAGSSETNSENINIFGEKIKYYPILDSTKTQCFFKPMDKVIIYASNRFQQKQSNLEYSKIFEGLLDNASVNYSNGAYNVSLNARDLMKWLELSFYDVNPALDNESYKAMVEGGKDVTPFTSNLAGMNPIEIIKSMVVGNVAISNDALVEIGPATYKIFWDNPEYKNKLVRYLYADGKTLVPNALDPNPNINLKAALKEPTRKSKGNILSTDTIKYYIKGQPIKGCGAITLVESYGDDPNKKKKIKTIQQETNFNNEILLTDPNLKQFPTILIMFGSNFNLWEHEYKSRYEICQDVINILECEFFMDCDGTLVFKPPYYNYNPGRYYKVDDIKNTFKILNGDQYLILHKDILSYNFDEDDKSIVTVFWVKGENNYLGSDTMPFIASNNLEFDTRLIRQFGLRIQSKTMPFMGLPEDAKQRKAYASAFLNRRNSQYRNGSMTIQMRPELHLGRTIAILGEGIEKEVILYDFNPYNPYLTTTCDLIDFAVEANMNEVPFSSERKKNLKLSATLSKEETRSNLESIMVYYILGINHSWSPGNSSTTTLTLGYGRYWNSFLGTLEYTLDEKTEESSDTYIKETNELYKSYIKLAREADQKIQKDYSEVQNINTQEQFNNLATENGKIKYQAEEYVRLKILILQRDAVIRTKKENRTKAFIVAVFQDYYISNDTYTTANDISDIYEDDFSNKYGVNNFRELATTIEGLL